MQSRWVDRDAKAAVDRYARRRASRPSWRCASTPRGCSAAIPTLVLHGGGNTSVKTRMRDLAGDEVDVLCVKGTGGDMATIEPAGMPAVRLDAAAQAARARRTVRRRHGARAARQPARSDGAEPVGRTAAARLHAAQVRRSHPRQRGAQPDRPARRRERCARRSMATASASCPTCGRASASPRPPPRPSTRIPRSKALILDKHGIFTFGASAKESYERMIEMVTPRRGAAEEEPQGGVRDRAAAAAGRAERRRRADRARRLRARRTPAAKARTGA